MESMIIVLCLIVATCYSIILACFDYYQRAKRARRLRMALKNEMKDKFTYSYLNLLKSK